jgi:predicted GNAT family acetyltransferase
MRVGIDASFVTAVFGIVQLVTGLRHFLWAFRLQDRSNTRIGMNHSSHAILDNAVWSALTSRQAHLRQGGPLAFRYHPDVAPFAAVADKTEAALRELSLLMQPHEQVVLPTTEPLPPTDAVRAERFGVVLQMVATGEPDSGTNDDVIRLNEADAEDMFELAQRTKPGPFGKRTHEMGQYIGIRDQGRLIAMAGERMLLDGYVEISAVCVDDAFRGRRIAGRLMNILRREIVQRGETPFLHVFDDNHSAIGLYERLGFESRQAFILYRVKPGESGAV